MDTAYWHMAAGAKQGNPGNGNASLTAGVDATRSTAPPMSTTSSATTAAAGATTTAMLTMNMNDLDTPGGFASTSATATAARILAQPESVRAEVEDTLGRLRERYQQLQRQLQDRASDRDPQNSATTTHNTDDDMSLSVASASAASASAADDFSNDEWIALSVLRGALPQGDSYSQAGSDSMDMDEDHTDRHHAAAAGDDPDSHGAANDEGSRDSTEPSECSLPKRARLD
jgi:hypothetical protein